MIPADLVEQLWVPTEPLAHKLKLNWLSNTGSFIATKLCKVKFGIGDQYTNIVTFSVAPMKMCHHILNRPRQWNHWTHDDGHLNTYAFKYKGTHIVLHPLPPVK